jgi:hypothetical protein
MSPDFLENPISCRVSRHGKWCVAPLMPVKQQYSCGANGGKADDEMREGGFCPSLCLLIPEDMVIKSSGFNWDSLFLPDLFPHAHKKNKP